MKKTVFAALLSLALACTGFTAYAQDDYEFDRNEVNFSYGVVSLPAFANTVGAVFGAAFSFGLAQPSLDLLGNVNLGYYHWFTDGFGVGVESSLELIRLEFKSVVGKDEDGNKIYDTTKGGFTTYASVMPAIKGRWLARPHFGIYSKLAVGGALQHAPAVSTTDKDGNPVNTPAANNLMFALQLTPIGFEFGGTHIKGFTELGLGYQGLLCAGLKYSF